MTAVLSFPQLSAAAAPAQEGHAVCCAQQILRRQHRSAVVRSSCSLALQASSTSFGSQQALQLQPELQRQQLQPLQLSRRVRTCRTFEELLALVQGSGKALSADDIIAVLHRASSFAKSTRQKQAFASVLQPGIQQTAGNSRGARTNSSNIAAAQQLVSLSLQVLLEVTSQLTSKHLANCLLSLAVLCGKQGPAAGAINSLPQAQSRSSASSGGHSLNQQQQQPGAAAAALQMLIIPASSRGLQQLLVAVAPHHQLQQLLQVTADTCLPAAEPYQLTNMLYGLAALPLRPSPEVLQQLLHTTGAHLGQSAAAASSMEAQLTNSGITALNNSSGRSSTLTGATWSPKVLSQLLWSAATLQLQPPNYWLDSYWAISQQHIPQYQAQDIANTAWAAASLQLEPPAEWLCSLMQQAQEVCGSMTGQGLANTLWGLAVLQPCAVPVRLLQQALQCSIRAAASLDRQNLANIFWAVAECLKAQNQQLPGTAAAEQDAVPAAAVSSSSRASSSRARSSRDAVHEQLQQLLSSCIQLLPRLQPRDWSNILWACATLQLHPCATVLDKLWCRTPAGFSTSLNPHNMELCGTAWSPQALANCIWGCAKLGLRPSAVWMRSFEAAAAPLLPAFSDQLLANMMWAFGELQHTPSDAWLQRYWIHAARLAQHLATAVHGATPSVTDNSGIWHSSNAAQHWQQQQQDSECDVLLQQLEAAAAHVVMVLQAAGRLGMLPPVHWLQQAVEGLTAAAAMDAPALQGGSKQWRQQQPWHSRTSLQLKTFTAAVHSLASLHRLVMVHGSSSGVDQAAYTAAHGISNGKGSLQSSYAAELVAKAAQALLLQLGVISTAANANDGHQLKHLSAMDVLLLLSSLPHLGLDHSHAVAASSQLLLRCEQLLGEYSSCQLVEIALVTAALTHQSSIGSTEDLKMVASSSSSSRFVAALAAQLQQHCNTMTAYEVSRSLVAIVQLQSQAVHAHGSNITQRQRSTIASFAAAAAGAVSQHMARMTANNRAALAAALARLQVCPQFSWLQALLLHSACDLSQCSTRDLFRLLGAVSDFALLLQRRGLHAGQHIQTGQQMLQAASALAAGTSDVLVQQVQDWLTCWLAECESRLGSLTPQQLVALSVSLARLVRRLQPQQQLQQIRHQRRQLRGHSPKGQQHLQQEHQSSHFSWPAGWKASYLTAVLAVFPCLSSADLVAVTVAMQQMRLKPSHEWCTAGATEAANRAQDAMHRAGAGSSCGSHSVKAAKVDCGCSADALTQAVAEKGCNTASSSCSSSSSGPGMVQPVRAVGGASRGRPFKVHYVGLLAYAWRRMAYKAPWEMQQVLLQFALHSCTLKAKRSSSCVAAETSAAGAAVADGTGAAVVPPRQLYQLLALLPRAGWLPNAQWVQLMKQSAAAQRLQRRMGSKQWQQLWSSIRLWEHKYSQPVSCNSHV